MPDFRLFGGRPDATGYSTGNADSETEHHVGYPNGSMCRSLICNAGASSMQSMIPIVGSASWRLASADDRVGSLTRDRSLVHENASKQHAHEGKGPGRRRTVRYGIRGLDELAGEAGGGAARYGIRSASPVG
jgi:hypothetical protein